MLLAPELLPNPSMDEFIIVETYLRHGKYLDGLRKGEKANLMHKCHNNFLFESGLLYNRRSGSTSEAEELWRVVCEDYSREGIDRKFLP